MIRAFASRTESCKLRRTFFHAFAKAKQPHHVALRSLLLAGDGHPLVIGVDVDPGLCITILLNDLYRHIL